MTDPTNPRNSGAPIPGLSCLAFLIGLVLAGLLAVTVFSGKVRSQALPELSRKRFDSAWETWQASGPASYQITIKVEGRQPAEYKAVVHEGRVVQATRNQYPLTQQRTMGTWSVPGMFDTIEYDVRVIEGENMTEQQRAAADLLLRAEFDSQYGYPAKYLRSDFAMKTTTRWQVTEFTVLQPDAVHASVESAQPIETPKASVEAQP